MIVESVPRGVSEVLERFTEVTPCGSRVTCDPPPADTDEDHLVLVVHEDHLSAVVAALHDDGYVWEGDSQHYKVVAGTGFMSWRKGRVNYIVTTCKDFATRHKRATLVCKRLNLMNKADRIGVFQAVLYGE